MKAKEIFKRLLDNVESYICQFLLSFFIILLFVQIISREVFSVNISWGEELARFSFVWFVFFGASFAARLAAHNRVTIQFRWFSKKTANYIEAFADLIWIFFNIVIIYKSIFLINSMLQYPYISPTLGWSMAYIYMIFPLSFSVDDHSNHSGQLSENRQRHRYPRSGQNRSRRGNGGCRYR